MPQTGCYDFWVKCAPVSAHIRLKEANLNSKAGRWIKWKVQSINLRTLHVPHLLVEDEVDRLKCGGFGVR